MNGAPEVYREIGDLAPKSPRFKLVPFNEVQITTERNYLVKGLIPREGLTVLWGPPKCGKSFLAFDMVMHVALGWEYRGWRVRQGPVIYVACEGAHGFRGRVEAFRQRHLSEDHEPPPFYLVPATLDLIADHVELINSIEGQADTPAAVVIDTLNRSLKGSESRDEDMAEYIQAADAIREKFNCAVIVVHHCGINDSRPRGHTSLTGAADAQIAIKRDHAKNIIAILEWAKDGPEGETFASKLELVEVGTDDDDETITSCVVVPVDVVATATTVGPKLTANQQTMLTILIEAGPDGLTVDEWNEKAREVGIGTNRKATLYDIRKVLNKDKKLVHETMDRWYVTRP